MRNFKVWILSVISIIALTLSACAPLSASDSADSASAISGGTESREGIISENPSEIVPSLSSQETSQAQQKENNLTFEIDFSIDDIAPYSEQPYAVVNNNVPYFLESDLTDESFEIYSELDDLGRCGTAYANICTEIMPTEERGEIGQIKPSGWHTVKYNDIDGNYVYNRCHLIAYQLVGENAEVQNLITGTRYLNVQGMLPFENQVADYVEKTNNHVLYRVTPIFEGENLVASGVLMEAKSVEDNGKDVQFCVYVYNVQPGIEIDYLTGECGLIQEKTPQTKTPQTPPPVPEVNTPPETQVQEAAEPEPQGTSYILNKNTKKFHYPNCSSVSEMKEKNKLPYTGDREDVISQGYVPCKRCNP